MLFRPRLARADRINEEISTFSPASQEGCIQLCSACKAVQRLRACSVSHAFLLHTKTADEEKMPFRYDPGL